MNLRNSLLVFSLLLMNSCHSGNDIKKRAEDFFEGYKKIIKKPDSIPEIIPEHKNISIIDVPVDIESNVINYSLLIDSTYYVKLQTTSESLIGDIDKILFGRDRIIIIEKLQRKSALLFTNDGKFIRKIGKEGNGPGEYVNLRDIAIDFDNGMIVLMDDFGRKILYFDLDGNYLYYKKLYYYSVGFSILDNGCFIFFQDRSINSHIPSICDYNLIFA